MRLVLLVLSLQFIAIVAKSPNNDLVWKSNRERKSEIIAESQQQVLTNSAPAGPYCQSLVAYFVGDFQSKSATAPSFSAQFQVRLDANLKNKRIFVEADQWNEQISNSSDFGLDYYYSNSYEWCDIKEEECSSSFSRNVTSFTLDINNQNGDYFHLLYFNYFNNSFALSQATDKCTKHQLDGLNDEWTPDLDELNVCVCCDEYTPNALLGCQQDPWDPVVITTTPTIPTTTTVDPPFPSNIQCKSIVAYYNGIFSNDYDSSDAMPVEFQVRMWADARTYYAEIDHWNEEKTSSSDIQLYLYSGNTVNACIPPTNNNCSRSYSERTDIWLEIDHDIHGNVKNYYYFSYFPSFYNQFVLQNAVGQCTKFQPKLDDSYVVNPDYFDFCMCCGDVYNPHPSLGCPVNPWA